jgi:signal transduction histidine kinase/CheY-like chemotaxis protein
LTLEGAGSGSSRVFSEDRVREEQMRVLFRTAPVGLNAALVGAFVLCGVLLYLDAQTPAVLARWMALVIADFALRQGICAAFRKVESAPFRWRAWAATFTVATLVGGLVWGVGGVFVMTSSSTEQLIVMLFVSATASGAVPAFGSYLPVTYAYSIPALLPFVVWSATRGDPLHLALTLMGMVFLGAFTVLAWRFNANLIASLLLRFENLDLVESLERQRNIAEQANIAKSRFLAAASHDLRQPVHALGMFVSALRGRSMDAEAERLVEHLDGSVEALDSLFVALLDISRLDAGIVQSQLESFAVQPMLERICADHAGEAAAKGIGLVLHPCAAIVHSDAVLIERIVRNIVANAVRCTRAGRVVVGCRRRGERLVIEVWDTGRGIAPEQQERVFEEFYQLDNPERDRAKGLGLGLAIVRRLSLLLDCPVTVASEPGKGSVFRVSVPQSNEAPRSEAAPAIVAAPAAVSGGLILVVDDELAIQEAMRSLLAGWGYEAIVAGSCAQMLERIADCTTRPDLIISDYRLRGGENGIETILRLQSEFNADIPAMLITGDTAPDRLKEARQSGFLLLHKPVPRGKLRAAIGNLINRPTIETADADG